MALKLASILTGAALAALPITVAAGVAPSAGASGDGASWPTITKQASIASLVPSSIAKSGVLTVASDSTYAPMEYLASDNTTVVGVDADLMKAVGQVLGLKTQITSVTFDDIIPKLQTNSFDVGASSFTDTKAREKVVNFVDYFNAGEGFYELASAKALSGSGLLQLCGQTVSVEIGTTEQDDAATANTACHKAHKSGVSVLAFSTQTLANLAVSDGHATVGFADSEVSAYIVSTSGGTFKNTGSVYASAPYGLAVVKTGANAKLDVAIEGAVNYLVKSGQYGTILKYWGQTKGGVKTATLNKALF